MRIYQFSQQGKRKNNEDSYGINDVLLTVCDGMGGHNYGERASAFVVEQMLKSNKKLQSLSKTDIQQQLNHVQTALNQLLEKEPELEKMGTTFTGIFKTQDVWYAAHIGDSRIYLFRPSENKLWHTWDHSLVGDLMRMHEITLEAGRFHPMSNRISKAIIAQKEEKIASASIVKMDELKEGDILLLCSDGVVEAWGDWELVQLFADESLTFEEKCQKLAKQCDDISKDNNTAIIAEIQESDAFSYGQNDELEWTSFEEIEADYQQYLRDNGLDENQVEEEPQVTDDQYSIDETPEERINNSSSKSSRTMWIGITALLGVLIIILLCFFMPKIKNAIKKENPSIEKRESTVGAGKDKPSKQKSKSATITNKDTKHSENDKSDESDD